MYFYRKEVITIRDPKRIEECLYYIDKIWQSQPDIRFNQLISNLQYEFSEDNEHAYYHEAWTECGEYTMVKSGYVDLFNLEDDVFIEWLKKRIG